MFSLLHYHKTVSYFSSVFCIPLTMLYFISVKSKILSSFSGRILSVFANFNLESRRLSQSYSRNPSTSFGSYFFFFIIASTDWSTIKKQSNAAIVILVHQDDRVPWNVINASIVALIRTPNSVPKTLPTPPVSSVPPMTEEAIASISKPFACSTNPPSVFKQNRMLPIPQRKPSSTYAFSSHGVHSVPS